MNRAGTTVIVTQYSAIGAPRTTVSISSLDLAAGERPPISTKASLSSPNFGVSGSATFDRVVVVENSPSRAVVKQRC